MPTFDGGHYFLSALVPVRTDPVEDGGAVTSPVHALRKRLDMMPTPGQTPARAGEKSPFTCNTRNHFVRLVIIDDVAYNGRSARSTLLNAARPAVLTAAQPQDHLSCPFLLFAVDFDAKSGSAEERDSYLAELWSKKADDLRKIFRFCQGFDARVRDAASFAAYIADCQLETTMSFNDYYATVPDLPAWPQNAYKWAAIASGGAAVLGLIATLLLLVAESFTQSLQSELRWAVAVTLVGAVAFVIVLLTAYVTVTAAGAKPFPAAPDSDLPTVLKALHLQRTFTRFAIDNQMLAADGEERSKARSAQQLHQNFAAFLAANKPQDLGEPTQAPGVIPI
jgi:hypothetical protein